jgi:tripartite-type tricarboxylate transporter receptor subunit TctC
VEAVVPVQPHLELGPAIRSAPLFAAHDSYSFAAEHTRVCACRLLSSMTGVSMLHVPYKSSPLPDVVSRQVDLAFEPATTAMPLVKSGRLRALAVSSGKRQPALPDVPAVAETVPNFSNDGWMALVAPAGTPQPIIDRLNVEAVKVLKSIDVRSRIADLGLQAAGSTAAECAALMRSEYEKWGRIARQYDIRAE